MNYKLVFLFLSCLFLFGCSVSEKDAVKYINKKYKVDAVVTSPAKIDTSNMGDTYIAMEDENGVEFFVEVKGFLYNRIVGDDYLVTIKENEFKNEHNGETVVLDDNDKLLNSIKKLGFNNIRYDMRRDFDDKLKEVIYIELFVGSNEDVTIDLSSKLYSLVKLLKKESIDGIEFNAIYYEKLDDNNKSLVKIYTPDEYTSYYTGFDVFNSMVLRNIKKINSLDDLKQKMYSHRYYTHEGQVVASNVVSKDKKYKELINKLDNKFFDDYKIVCGTLYDIGEDINSSKCEYATLLLNSTDSFTNPSDEYIDSLVNLILQKDLKDNFITRVEILHADEYEKVSFNVRTLKDDNLNYMYIEELVKRKYNF